jgi:tetratricopeptide (TPR) repeat protein
MKRPFPPDTLAEPLGRHFFLGRSTAHLPSRHGVILAEGYRAALDRFPAKLTPRLRAERGRLKRVLGDAAGAAADLDAALAADPGLAAAYAWRWELRAAGGSSSNADIEKAAALEPKNGWWRLWLALGKMTKGAFEAALDDARAAGKFLPREALPLAVQGLILYKLKRRKDALAPLGAALRLDPGLEWGWRLRGICKYEEGDREGCLADCMEAMRLDENCGLLFVMLGLHALKTDSRQSLAAATRHLEKNPDDFWAYVFRADVRRGPEIGENLGALEDLRRAAELEPRRGFVWAYLSRCQITLGDFRSAAESLRKAVALEPKTGWIRAWHGEFLRRTGDAAGAAKALDLAVRLSPGYELAYAWRGSARRLLGKPKDAVADLNIAIALKPHTIDLCLFERMHAYRALGRTAEALEDIQRASALNPKYLWEAEPKSFARGLKELDGEIKRSPANALAHLWRGDIMMRLRDFSRAEKDLSRALALKTCPPEALILRGRTRGELGKWKAAFVDFDAAIRRDPESAFAYAWRGRARMLQDDLEAAIADFERALELETNSAWLLSWKGEAEYRLGRDAAAEASLSKAIEVHVKFADAFLWRGAVRLGRGDREGSMSDLNQALSLQPGNALALYFRGKLYLKHGYAAEGRADYAKAAEAPGLLSSSELNEVKAVLREPAPAAAPAAPDALVEKARALQKEGRHEEAAAIYGALLAERESAELYGLRAEAYRCMGRYDLALADQSAIVKLQPGSADALSGRVEFRRHLWDFEGGLKDAEAAIALDPSSASAWVQKSECLRSLGRYDEAIASATKAVERDASWPWARIVRAKARRQKGDLEGALADTREAENGGTDAYARGWRAEILRKTGRLKEALADINTAAALQPNNAWFKALRGQIQVELGAGEKGLADLLEAMRLDTRCSCDYDFLGAEGPLVRADAALDWVYAWRGGVRRAAGDLPAARADLDHAVRLSPSCFWILAWHGELLLTMGEAAAGLAELKRALKLGPRYAQAWVWAGQALLKEEKTAGALKAFASALALEPSNVWGLIGRAVCLEKTGKSAEAAALFARARALAPGLFPVG